MSELSREALTLIEQARAGDAPSTSDRDRMRAKLSKELGAAAFAGVALGGAAAASSLGSTSAAATGSAPATGSGLASAVAQQGSLFGIGKVVLAALVVGSLGLGGMLLFSHEATKPLAKHVMPAQAPAQPLAKTLEPAPELTPSAPTPAEPAPTEMVREAPATQPKRVLRAKPARSLAPAPSEPESVPVPAAIADADSLKAELALISQAQLALRQGHAEQALGALREHEARFAQGSLREERLGLMAMAECARGKDSAQVLREFSAAAPRSPLLRRVREACAEK